MIGELVGHYRVVEKIGAGGMGEVFRARDERLGRDVALKVIRPASDSNPDHLRRFEQEARAAAALNHPNILAIYDVGFEGSTPYIVSELLEGKTLRQRLSEGPMPVREASSYALQIVLGLTAAHERHIVHRDLKPENLFLTDDGRVKILDFGVAKLQESLEGDRDVDHMTTVTKHGAVIGTVAYMSPEQLRSKAVDHRSDIFSFGAILYEMLSGRRAFRGETEVDTMTAVLREEPPPADLESAAIPAAYQEIVRHSVEKDPENRFQSAKDLAFALQTLSGSSPNKALNLREPKTPKSIALPWAAAAVMTVAVVVLAVARWMHAPDAQPSYRRLTFEAGTVYAARFSSDGQSIIYGAAWGGKPIQLFSTVGNSLLAQPLDFTHANLLAISSNNDLALVLNGNHNGQLESIDGVLARAPMAGGSPRELLSDVRWADWNPKNQLAVVHDVSGHSRLEFPIGNVLYQSGGWISNIRFSPAGDKIAFMDHPALFDNRGLVSVVDLSGHVQNLTSEWEAERGLSWRPDGTEIWFTAAGKRTVNLMAVTLDGKVRTVLDLPVAMDLEDIASDGRALVSLDSQRLAVAFTTLGSQGDVDLSWHDWEVAKDISPDGQFVLFEDVSEAAGGGYSVMLRKLDGTFPVRLGEGSSGSLSPDGKWAATISLNQKAELTLLPIGPGQPRTIHVTGIEHIHNAGARFFPDGKQLAVLGDNSGHAARCYLIDLSNGSSKPITPEGTLCGPIAPDGKAIIGKTDANTTGVYPVDGGEPHPIPNLDAAFIPVQWSDDGSSLYGYHTGEFPSKVYRVALTGGKESLVRQLKPGSPAGVVMVAPVIVSRDGKRFAYSYNETLSVLYLISGLR